MCYFIELVLLIVSILTGSFIFYDERLVDCGLCILPICYVLIVFLFVSLMPKESLKNIGISIFAIQSVMRCVVAPLFMFLGGYESFFASSISIFRSEASGLLLYEQFICVIVCYFSYKRNRSKVQENSISDQDVSPLVGCGKFNWLLIIWAAFMLLCWFVEPSIPDSYTTIMEMIASGDKFTGATEELQSGSAGRILNTLFSVLFKSFRIIFPIYLIAKIGQKYKSPVGLFLSCIIVSVQFFFITSTIANALIIVFIIFVYILSVYEKYQKATMTVMCFSLICSISFVINLMYRKAVDWYGYANIFQYLSSTFQGYITGVDNVAGSFLIQYDDKLALLVNTMVSAIPFQGAILGGDAIGESLNTLFTSLFPFQIISTIGGGKVIFGTICAPVFSAIFVYYSVKYSCLYQSSKKFLYRVLYLYLAIQLCLGVGVYNIQITFSNWLQVGLPLYMFANFFNK